MLSNDVRQAFNQGVNAGQAYKLKLGNSLSNVVSCVKGVYDFARQGGAVGSVVLLDDDNVPVVIPSGALILNAFCVVKTAVTSGGAATIALHAESAGDLLAATAKASFSLNAKLQGIPDLATLADSVLTTANRALDLDIAVAALTAGKIEVYVMYVLT